jgi:hypothetical protein
MKETAIADELAVLTENDCELRRQTGPVPTQDFFQESRCLLAGKNT